MRNKFLALTTLFFAATLVHAQDAKAPDTGPQAQPEPYQITVTLKITDHGKLTTDQTFTLAAATQVHSSEFTPPSVRDGDRIPVPTDKNGSQYQYVDTGTDIDVEHLRQIGPLLGMQLKIVNSGALPSPASQTAPIFRTLRYSLVPVVPLGKLATIYSSGDGINSQKVEIQLLANPLSAK